MPILHDFHNAQLWYFTLFKPPTSACDNLHHVRNTDDMQNLKVCTYVQRLYFNWFHFGAKCNNFLLRCGGSKRSWLFFSKVLAKNDSECFIVYLLYNLGLQHFTLQLRFCSRYCVNLNCQKGHLLCFSIVIKRAFNRSIKTLLKSDEWLNECYLLTITYFEMWIL